MWCGVLLSMVKWRDVDKCAVLWSDKVWCDVVLCCVA